MKTFFLFLFLCVGFVFWLRNWVSTGNMDRFIKEHPNSKATPVVVRTVGDVYYHIFRQSDSAIRYYQWFVQDFPLDNRAAEVHWDLGLAYEELGKKDLALEQYTILRSSYSTSKQAQMALERYNRIRY